MLQKFYEDQEKYSFPFQMMAYISRLSLIKETIDKTPNATFIITERSLYTDKYIFAKMLFDTKKIEYVNYQIYCKWFDVFAKEYPIHKTIYVKTDPNICQERIHKRSRTGENGIPLDYLESCHTYHEDMIKFIPNSLILDGNMDIFEKENTIEEWLQEIAKIV